jgi:hypothetical protein
MPKSVPVGHLLVQTLLRDQDLWYRLLALGPAPQFDEMQTAA